MWVKICGISTMKAALAAVEAGADALGFIFANSRRQIDPDRALGLIQGLPGSLQKVGVFVDTIPREMQRIADYTGLTAIQMHGAEPPEWLSRVDRPVIKALRIKGPADLLPLPAYRAAAGLLLDPYVEGQHGGTGLTLDWQWIRRAAEILQEAGVQISGPDEPLTPGRPKLILAGGLTPGNVAAAVLAAQPGGVDVSSGVETGGVKDLAKIYDFVAEAKEALA